MQVKNILAIRNDRFGEFLLNIPALRALKQSFSGSRLTLVVNPYVRELAECIEFVDEIITWENRKHKFSELFAFSRELKERKFELCVILNPSKEFHLVTFLAGIPKRAGYARKWGFLLTHKIEDKKYLGNKHEIDYNLDLVSVIQARTDDKSLRLNIDSEDLLEGYEDKSFLVLHPWTSDAIKQWPIGNFVDLAKRITQNLNLTVLIIGGKNERTRSSRYLYNLHSNIIDLTGKTTLKELAIVLKKSRLLVSGDSGPIHLASCVETPVIALFRNDIPGKSPTRWGPVSKGSVVVAKSNIADITVDEVFYKVKEVLKI